MVSFSFHLNLFLGDDVTAGKKLRTTIFAKVKTIFRINCFPKLNGLVFFFLIEDYIKALKLLSLTFNSPVVLF